MPARPRQEGLPPTTPSLPGEVIAYEVPLEIGYTLPGHTLAYLECDGGVARWSYGGTDRRLLVNTAHPPVG
ncbi:hypothetical protein ABT390_37425 [Streptomyces aurantiacus]|uniref:Uncharacterized protein n=1 Tax=Streptomyces aurantiacus JA 4570 TaxID=1286094 RepID=S3Z8Z1_9ACTN|nr:hypothetical protein [Streptomyces aurantiacus]EPH40166.1 hypothetical protein STRAU_6779 [Streptomyces aurantiacus JA 4570]